LDISLIFLFAAVLLLSASLRRSVHLSVLSSAIASQFTQSESKGRTLVLSVLYSAISSPLIQRMPGIAGLSLHHLHFFFHLTFIKKVHKNIERHAYNKEYDLIANAKLLFNGFIKIHMIKERSDQRDKKKKK
jgi:hypothetical protein